MPPTDTTQAIDASIRSRKFEFVAALAAAFLLGAFSAAAIVVSYNLTPLPVALDVTRAGAVALLTLAVLGALIRQATVAVLRSQRETREEMAQLVKALERADQPSPFDHEVKAAVADIATFMDDRRR